MVRRQSQYPATTVACPDINGPWTNGIVLDTQTVSCQGQWRPRATEAWVNHWIKRGVSLFWTPDASVLVGASHGE